jgi:hypothetical protein
MTDGIRSTILQMTGAFVPGCPWHAFKHPIVRDVMQVLPFVESGNLEFVCPEPSHRLVEAVALWTTMYNRMMSKQLEIEREQKKREIAEPIGSGMRPVRRRR